MLSSAELRKKFLDFFSGSDHVILPSASLVPKDDPSLLLTVAGMVPFKPYFLGKAEPPHKRVATVQKCLRTPDLDIVGKTARHHTFFEMLGNFSFGDYFKKEAIAWAWEYLTKVLGLSPKDLWITVYKDDDEAAQIWKKVSGFSEDRIVPLGEESNFWAAGPVGPCGPCSEIIVDLGPERGCKSPTCGVDCDCDRFLEVWNLVFMQFYRDENGNFTKLPRQNIDTGMGLERIASVMQGAANNFETDLLFPLIKEAAFLAGIAYGEKEEIDISLKVIADHARAITFLIADGVLPSNEGRGYVLRRILRRAVRYGRLLGIEDIFLNKIIDKVISLYEDPYHELREREEYIKKIIALEEERFGETLEQGLQILHEYLEQINDKGERVFPGKIAFRLYDTFGFPLELTNEIVAERGISVDLEGFNDAMEEQKERARAARVGVAVKDSSNVWACIKCADTVFEGYSCLATRSQILFLISDDEEQNEVGEERKVQVILDTTPFYPEGGGQIGDRGIIKSSEGEIVIEDTKKIRDGIIVHQGYVRQGIVSKGEMVLAQVDERVRRATARNHTATHLLHKSLQVVLGDHVQQMGSLVEAERLRFDFSHFASLTQDELRAVEELVNSKILENLTVTVYETEIDKALEEGVTALFGEKYGKRVRVVKINDFSKELCGGTHVRQLSEVGFLKIVSESGIGTGIRRIEAITGETLLAYWNNQFKLIEQMSELLKVTPDNLLTRMEQVQNQLREYEKELDNLRNKILRSEVETLMNNVIDINGAKILAVQVNATDMESLRSLGDMLKERIGSGVIILGSPLNGKVGIVSFVTSDLVKSAGLHAGNIVKEVARVVEGGGGGKPDMAQAGGKNPGRLDEALRTGEEIVRRKLLKVH